MNEFKMVMNAYSELWKIYLEFMNDQNIKKDFILGAQNNLKKYYEPTRKTKNLIDFLNDKSLDPSLEDVILASFFLISLGIDLFENEALKDKNRREIEKSFTISAKFLEMIIKYGNDSLSEKRKRKILLISAICYDLSNNPANCIVLAKKIHKNRDESDFPLEPIQRLEYFYQVSTELLLSRNLDECIQTCNLAFELKNSFDEIIENEEDSVIRLTKINQFMALIKIITGIYNWAVFWREGNDEDIKKSQKNIFRSGDYFVKINDSINLLISDLLNILCKKIKKRSIFNYLDKKNKLISRYIKELLKQDIYEFWPPQIKAIRNGLFKKDNLVIAAPTSAGKSLMAELAIIKNKSTRENNNQVCFYIAPSRALANQVANTLNKRLNPIGMIIVKLIGGVSDKIDEFLLNNADICVCTPEKFYQLHKNKHKIFLNSNLIIFDEGHLIGDRLRGIDLEFEITKLLNNYPEKRLIFISAVIKNFDEIAKWFKTKNIVTSEWKPTRTIHALLENDGTLNFYDDLLGFHVNLSDLKRGRNLGEKAALLTQIYHKRLGMILIFANSKPFAEEVAETIYKMNFLRDIKNERIEILIKLIEKEMGKEYPLINYLKKGLTFHHGSLPNELRIGIEELIEKQIIKIVISTTTLAEGVNTPVSCIIIPSLFVFFFLINHYYISF